MDSLCFASLGVAAPRLERSAARGELNAIHLHAFVAARRAATIRHAPPTAGLAPRRGARAAPVKMAAEAAGSGPAKKEGASGLKVALYIGLWYAFNIVYNISNKRALNMFPLAWFVSWFQLVIGVAYSALLWATGLRKKPVLADGAIKAIAPVAAAHTVGHVGTVASLGMVAVSFTHVVKSLEPFVNVLASAVILKSVFPIPVYLSLLPVVAGVIMASVSEVSFTWMGFSTAMLSNFAFTGRNIFSKLNMNTPKGENMDAVNLFSVIQVISAIGLAPFALLADGAKIKSTWLAATTGASAVAPQLIITNLVISGLFFQLYQEVAFKALNSVHPVTHAVANTVKRVVIIVTSILVFGNPVTRANATGSTIAILGVFLYSITKNFYDKKEIKRA